MREVFLHRIWQNTLFEQVGLTTVQGEVLHIFDPGVYLQQAGPDFFNARLQIGAQKWAGNVEIHVKASDWYAHGHENDGAYDNVILHVVWEYDMPVYRKDGTEIPVFILREYVGSTLLDNYRALFQSRSWIPCEGHAFRLDPLKELQWKERLYIERLEQKTEDIFKWVIHTQRHWEQVFFCVLARGFGLNNNAAELGQWAAQLPVEVIFKNADRLLALEALFFGGNGLLNRQIHDAYGRDLQREWRFLRSKYNLKEPDLSQLTFYKLRPDNFPTIRLAQLAAWYYRNKNNLQQILTIKNISELYDLFKIEISPYWQTHYVFDKESRSKRKALTSNFVDLLVINSVIPFLYVYHRSLDKPFADQVFTLLEQMKPEKNQVIERYIRAGFVADNALDSQVLLHLKKQYCDRKRCLNCQVGTAILYGK